MLRVGGFSYFFRVSESHPPVPRIINTTARWLPFKSRGHARQKIKTTIQAKSANNRTALRASKSYDGFAIIHRALNGETPSVPAKWSVRRVSGVNDLLSEPVHRTGELIHLAE
jgi:hypothetical protein